MRKRAGERAEEKFGGSIDEIAADLGEVVEKALVALPVCARQLKAHQS